MNAENEFEFLNSDLWLNYTQKRYLPPDEIKYRFQQQGGSTTDWQTISKKIISTRKTAAITLPLKSLEPKFWFYPADTIQKKIDEIDKIGKNLYRQINSQSHFQMSFFSDARREEAITSAIYEGAHSTRAQAQQLIASGKKPQNKDEWMLINSVKAMKWVKENTNRKLTREVILQSHKIVTENTLEKDDVNFSGKFRDDKIFVGPHQGVNHRLINNALDEMIEAITNNRRYFHPLIKCILIHYFVAYIHPFFDGNGRTARVLFYFEAMCNDLKYVELLSVSAYLKEHGREYEKSFEKVVQNDFDISYFIDFSLDSILSALEAVSKKVGYLLRMNELSERYDLSPNQIGLLQRMALQKFRSIDHEEYGKQIGKSREFARQELKRLVKLNLIVEMKVSKKLLYKINAAKLKELYQS